MHTKLNVNVGGAVLPVVLTLLLILTVLGVSSMSDSIIQQKSATNLYLENEAFHIAESAISATIYDARVGDGELYGTNLDDDVTIAQGYCIGENGYIAAQGAVDPDSNEEFCKNVNEFEGVKGIEAASVVEYLDCQECPGNSKGKPNAPSCHFWKVTGIGTVNEKTTVTVDSWVTKTAQCSSTISSLPNIP